MTKLYAVETGEFGPSDIAGVLITMEGEVVASHVSSSRDWLRDDLTKNFGRDKELAERFGEFEVVYVGMDAELPQEIAQHFSHPSEEQQAIMDHIEIGEE